MQLVKRNLERLVVLCVIAFALPVGSHAQDAVDLIRGTGASAVDLVVESISIDECFGRTDIVPVRPCDEVWFVNARDSHNAPCDLSRVTVTRLQNGTQQPSTLENLTSAHLTDVSRNTVVYIHGNQTDERWSVTRGMMLYKNMFLDQSVAPVRLVIWQWKSEREHPRLRKDYVLKAARAVELGKTLSATLASFQNCNLTVVGYSLGCQVALSSLLQPELATMNGCGLRVALIAPAIDAGFANSLAGVASLPSVVGSTKAFYNNSDRMLSISEFFARRKNRQNYVSTQDLLSSQQIPLGTFTAFEVSCEHGKRHSITRYSKTPTVKREVVSLIESNSQSCPGFFAEPKIISETASPKAEVADNATESDSEFVVVDPVAEDDSEYFATP